MLQYTLTELFEGKDGRTLTLNTYHEIGGISVALARRADGIYAGLDENGRSASRQLFLRLTTLGEGVEDTRRRVSLSELESIVNCQSSINTAVTTFSPSTAIRPHANQLWKSPMKPCCANGRACAAS